MPAIASPASPAPVAAHAARLPAPYKFLEAAGRLRQAGEALPEKSAAADLFGASRALKSAYPQLVRDARRIGYDRVIDVPPGVWFPDGDHFVVRDVVSGIRQAVGGAAQLGTLVKTGKPLPHDALERIETYSQSAWRAMMLTADTSGTP